MEERIRPSVFIQSVKDNMCPRRGRPVSCGVGRKLTIYFPQKTLDLMDRIQEQWSYESRSDLIQEAVARYAAELDGVMQEGDRNG